MYFKLQLILSNTDINSLFTEFLITELQVFA